jgi:hypothetical protein
MKTNWTSVLIGAAIVLAVVYYLNPSIIAPGSEGFADIDTGGIVAIVLFVVFICFGFLAIATHK